MKRILFIAGIGLIFGMIGLAILQPKSEAAGCVPSQAQACGYFTGGYVSATDNVLPNPALSGVNASGLTNAQKVQTFIGAVHYWMYRSTYRARVGAAFIIDSMLSYREPAGQPLTGPVGGGQTAGISYVTANNNANYNRWVALVNYYGSSTSSSYGIQWGYYPSKSSFCSGRLDSGYDPGVNDVALYHTPGYGTGNCDYEWTHSMPEIRFFWPGGTFEIGTLCGNVQDSAGQIPGPDQMPTATMTVACTASQQQVATVNFSDADGATSGYITINGWTSSSVASGGARQIPIPTSVTSPTNVQNVYLHVKDVGPVAPPNVYAIFQAQTSVPCVSYGCGIAITPSAIDPFMTYQATVSITTTGSGVPSGSTVNLTITPPSGVAYSYNNTQGVSGSGSPVSTVFNNIPATGRTGVYTAKATITTSSGGTSCTTTFPVVYLPYLNVYGGDVMTGASPMYSGGSSTCVVDTNGGIFSWNNVGSGYSGAGTQYAVQALGQIAHFATALKSSSTAPTGLSFANTFNPANAGWLNLGQGLFGGHFGAISDDCDFTSDLTVGPVSGASATTTITNLPATLGKGQTIIYATGNVYISRDIAYSTSGWSTPSDVPYFKLVVVGGSIYIASGVKNLDGIYVAEPSGGIGGSIYTCAKGNGTPWNPVSDYASGYYATCNQKLTINGVFVGEQVNFLRTAGSVGLAAKSADSLATNNDAEVFNYTPEVWLPRGGGSPNGGYTAITGLPPIL